MKISIIIAVYNEEELIKNCLKSLINSDYSKKDYEIVVVNDGSTDKTEKNVEKIIKENKNLKIKLINQENKGRAIAREVGAKKAKYPNILITDARCEVYKNTLKQIKKINYQPLIGNAITNQDSIFGRFNYLIRKKIYKNSFDKFQKIKITKDNFDEIGKGTGVLFIKKDLFLSSRLGNQKSKDNSDDTGLLRNIINKKDILKSPSVKVTYNSRKSLISYIKHTFNRGPKFVDYYFKPKRKYFPHIIAFLVGLIGIILLLIIDPTILIYIIIALIFGLILVSIKLSEKSKDFFILVYLLPITTLAFSFGIIKGILLKLFGRY